MKLERFNSFNQKIEEKLSPEAQDFINKKIAKLHDEGYEGDQAVAMAYSYAKRAGYKIPKNPNESEEPVGVTKEEWNSLDAKARTELLKKYIPSMSTKYAELEWDDLTLYIQNKLSGSLEEFDSEFQNKANEAEDRKKINWVADPDSKEMANIIYDTLMNNKQHPQLMTKDVDDQGINGNQIYFTYKGKEYTVTVEAGGMEK